MNIFCKATVTNTTKLTFINYNLPVGVRAMRKVQALCEQRANQFHMVVKTFHNTEG